MGEPYHLQLGINLKGKRSEELFKWLVASFLFGARISEQIAARTFKQLERDGLLNPKRMISAGWSKLVESLDRGGYVRYDFSTADRLLLLSSELLRSYGGDLNRLHELAKGPEELERKLKEFKGVGEVTANIFLRELRGIWPKANPPLRPPAVEAARNLGLTRSKDGKGALEELLKLWRRRRAPRGEFVSLETALLRLGRRYCLKSRCGVCPLSSECKRF